MHPYLRPKLPRFRVGQIYVDEFGRARFAQARIIAAPTADQAFELARKAKIPFPIVDNKPVEGAPHGSAEN